MAVRGKVESVFFSSPWGTGLGLKKEGILGLEMSGVDD